MHRFPSSRVIPAATAILAVGFLLPDLAAACDPRAGLPVDDGASWSPAGTSTSQTTAGVLDLLNVSSTGTLLAGLWGSRVYRSTDNGNTWSSTIMNEYTTLIAVPPAEEEPERYKALPSV